MSMTKWYAVQVETGREDAACALVLRAAEAAGLADAFDELFNPKRRTLSKVRGELAEGLEPLLPGYVIAVARPDDLGRRGRGRCAARRGSLVSWASEKRSRPCPTRKSPGYVRSRRGATAQWR